MVTSTLHTIHPLDVKHIRETDQQLIIEFRAPRAGITAGAMVWLVFILVPSWLVYAGLQSLDLLDNTLIRIVMMVAGGLAALVLLGGIIVLWGIYTDPPVLITFDRQSGLMTAVQGENTKTMPLTDIQAIILVNVRRGQGYVQLLLERTDGVIVALDLDSKIAPTGQADDKQYEPLAQRICQFLGLSTPVRYVSRNAYWQGESDLLADASVQAPGNC